MNKDFTNAVINVFRLLSNIEKDDHDITGDLNLSDEAVVKLDTLKGINNSESVFSGEIVIGENRYSNFSEHKEENVTICLTVDKSFFYENFDEFLENVRNKSEVPDYFYIWDIDYLHDNNESNGLVSMYQQCVKLVSFLKRLTDYSDLNVLLLISREKITIPIDYSKDDLCHLEQLDSLLNDFKADDQHFEQKKTIIKPILVNYLKNISEKDRFIEVCRKLDAIYDRYKDNYYLYLESIDVDKIIDEAEKRKIGYLSNISKVYSDMQGKLLTIPIALIPITQSKKNDCLGNFVIVLGVMLYVLIMWRYISSQWKTVDDIQDDKTLYFNKLIEAYKGCRTELTSRFQQLSEGVDKKYKSMQFSVCILYALLLLIIIVNYVFLIYVPHFMN